MQVLGRILFRSLLLILLAVVLLIAAVLIDGWDALGKAPEGKRLARIHASSQWKGDHFENPQPLSNDLWGSLFGMLHASEHVSPHGPVPTVEIDPKALARPAESGLRITWLGHATTLVEIEGKRVLTDPVWSERASPVSWLGPQRYYTPRIAITDLPPIDAVVISHDHYDHLDRATIIALAARQATFVVPLGIGAHLSAWGVPESRLIELDWWQRTQVNGIEIVCTPARHASGRALWDKDRTLWASYAVIGARKRVYFSGDTGLFSGMTEIGERLGPFDVTLIEVGQYHSAWPDWHIGPEQAVTAHAMLRGRVLLPIHWGLFSLAYHGWTEPAERVLSAANAHHVKVLMPKPGQSVEPTRAPTPQRWWPNLPWQTANQHPIVSSQVSR